MNEKFSPQTGAPTRGELIPPVSYLDWFIPRIIEQRPYDLSRSGLRYDWDLGNIEEAWKDHRSIEKDERTIISKRYDVDLENVHLCHGATQGLTLAIVAASNGGKVAVEMPSYGPVSQTARILGLETVRLEREKTIGYWPIERSSWAKQIRECEIVIISSHLNPTGWPISQDDRNWLVNQCKENNTILICDEVYADADPSWEPMFSEGEHCITINSLAKIHGLGQLRYGWIIASKKIIPRIGRAFHNLVGMMSSPGVKYGELALQHSDQTIKLINLYRKNNLKQLKSVLSRLGIEWEEPPCGLFGAIRIPGVNTFEMIETIGKEKGFLAVPCCMFDDDLEEWLRISWTVDEVQFKKSVSVFESVLRTAMNIT